MPALNDGKIYEIWFFQSHYKEDDTNNFYDDLSDEPEEEDIDVPTDEDEDDDDEIAGYSVENAYVEEKEEACLALKEIAEFAG